MTPEERYANAMAAYTYKRYHFFMFSHDDKTIPNYWKSKELTLKTILIIVLVLVGCAVLFSGMLALLGAPFITCFSVCLVLIAIGTVIETIYNFVLYLNYVEINEDFPPSIVTAIVACGLGYYLFKVNPTLTVLLIILVIYGSLRLMKAAYWDKCNPRPNIRDFEEDQ